MATARTEKRENWPLTPPPPSVAAEETLNPLRRKTRLPAAEGDEIRPRLRLGPRRAAVDERGKWRKKRKKGEEELREAEQETVRSIATGIE